MKENIKEYEIVFKFNFKAVEALYPDLGLKYLYSIVNRFQVYFGNMPAFSEYLPKIPLEVREEYSFSFTKNVENLEGAEETILRNFNKMVEDFKLTDTVIKEGNELYDRHSKDKKW